jgi:serine/threonine protein kinase/Tfp pilus assembly protein PilF
MGTDASPDRAKSQKDIMSVCLAVVRGILSPDQARAAILGRTASVPVSESLRLAPELLREAESLGQLPAEEKEECLAIFKELYDQPPKDEILREDRSLARALVAQRLVSPAQADECLAIQSRLAEAGAYPLPRVGELLMRKGHLTPGQPSLSETLPLPGGGDPFRDRIRQGLQSGLPTVVRELLADPSHRFGRYVRTQLLGAGGSGEVWKAYDLELGRWVALKFLKFEDAEELARLKREAQTAAKLSHPHIATIHEIAEARERTFLVMQYVEGQTLETHPRDNRQKLVSIMRDVALAIHYAHTRGVIHRDLKPGNIMVDTSGRPFVMDFGLARQVESRGSIPGMILGTPAYMPPEQATGGLADVRSDVYSLGATLYELLSDRPPFTGRNTLEILAKVTGEDPGPLPHVALEPRTILSKCLMKEPERRYPSAWELAEDLRRWQEGEPIQAHPPSWGYRWKKKILKRRAIVAVALGGILLAAGVALVEREKETRKQNALDQARPFLDEGRKIMERLDRVLATDDWTPESVKILTGEAQRQFDRALEISPGFPDALLEKGRAYQAAGNQSLALDYCARAIQASQRYATAHLQRARFLLDRYEKIHHPSASRPGPETPEERDLAATIRQDLNEVEVWSKDDREILFARGALAFVNGDYAEAGRSLQAYAQLVLADHRGWAWAGHSWLRVPGKEDEAIRALNEAIKFRPRTARFFVFRGFAYLHKAAGLRRRGELDAASKVRDQAGADFSHAVGIDPLAPEAHLGAGDVHRANGEAGRALAEYGEAIKLNPQFGVSYLRRADVRLERGDLEDGLSDAREAVRLSPMNPRGLLERALLYDARGNSKEALADLDQALRLVPNAPEALSERGRVKAHSGDESGAEEDFSRALELDPNLAQGYLDRGLARKARGDLKAAITDLSCAIALDQGNPWAYYQRGVAHGDQGSWEDAIGDFERGLRLSPCNPAKFRLRLWVARARHGDGTEARVDLSPALKTPSSGSPSCFLATVAAAMTGGSPEESLGRLLGGGTLSKRESCIAYYYLGEKALLEGKKGPARDLLKKCLETQASREDEFESARAALASIASE